MLILKDLRLFKRVEQTPVAAVPQKLCSQTTLPPLKKDNYCKHKQSRAYINECKTEKNTL